MICNYWSHVITLQAFATVMCHLPLCSLGTVFRFTGTVGIFLPGQLYVVSFVRRNKAINFVSPKSRPAYKQVEESASDSRSPILPCSTSSEH